MKRGILSPIPMSCLALLPSNEKKLLLAKTWDLYWTLFLQWEGPAPMLWDHLSLPASMRWVSRFLRSSHPRFQREVVSLGHVLLHRYYQWGLCWKRWNDYQLLINQYFIKNCYIIISSLEAMKKGESVTNLPASCFEL